MANAHVSTEEVVLARGTTESASTFRIGRIALYALLLVLAFFFLLPVYVMVVNSLKPLDEIRNGNLMALPLAWTIEPWLTAWSTAQIGVQPTGLRPYFINSFLMVVPAVFLSTLIGALNGYILTQFHFRGAHLLFAAMLFSVFIPYQIVLIPMAKTLGLLGLAGTIKGLVLVHVVYGIGFSTLFFRNYYAAFPAELVRSARMDGAGFFGVLGRILLPNSAPIIVVTVIWQFTNIWNDFLFGASFSDYSSYPITVALNNLVNSSTGVKEYNVHFAGAFIAALPTLLVYMLSGKYFVRGLMAGSVKG
jgi:glucose/mannose transport system permease protein